MKKNINLSLNKAEIELVLAGIKEIKSFWKMAVPLYESVKEYGNSANANEKYLLACDLYERISEEAK